MRTRLFLLFLAAALLAACGAAEASAAGITQETCPITLPDDHPRGLTGPEDGLRVFISHAGIWDLLPPDTDGGLVQKIMWKYPGYDWTKDPQPEFTLTAQEFGGDGYFESHEATNAFSPELEGSAILTGVSIPHGGCWEITGRYQTGEMSFTVWVGEGD